MKKRRGFNTGKKSQLGIKDVAKARTSRIEQEKNAKREAKKLNKELAWVSWKKSKPDALKREYTPEKVEALLARAKLGRQDFRSAAFLNRDGLFGA